MKKRRLHIIRDTREQDGFTFKDGFDPAPVVKVATLDHGDYSLDGFEARIAIERKSLQDLVGCLGRDRERFVRELERLRGYDFAAVVVEEPLSALRGGHFRGALDPKAGEQSVWAWSQRFGIPFYFCAGKADAERVAFDLLRHYASDRLKEAEALMRDWTAVEEST